MGMSLFYGLHYWLVTFPALPGWTSMQLLSKFNSIRQSIPVGQPISFMAAAVRLTELSALIGYSVIRRTLPVSLSEDTKTPLLLFLSINCRQNTRILNACQANNCNHLKILWINRHTCGKIDTSKIKLVILGIKNPRHPVQRECRGHKRRDSYSISWRHYPRPAAAP